MKRSNFRKRFAVKSKLKKGREQKSPLYKLATFLDMYLEEVILNAITFSQINLSKHRSPQFPLPFPSEKCQLQGTSIRLQN